MSCYHPLKAFFTMQSDGKKKISFYNNSFVRSYDSFPDDNKILIPCGQCSGCRLEYSRQWAVRCVLEAMQYEHNYFLTLTYDDEHLPVKSDNISIDDDTGEVSYFSSSPLVPHHLTKFMKDLRRYFSYHYNVDNIRFFACGEYGDKFLRPHFHLIIFNIDIPDLKFIKSNFNGDRYYSSEIISKIWDNGFVCIGDCNFSTCSYVARYMMKKQKGKNADYYDKVGLVPPFVRCSRDPGIARNYYDENSDKVYTYDSLCIVGSDGVAKRVRPPSYFDRLYDIDSPEAMARIKEKRSNSAKNSIDSKLSHTSLSHDEFLAVSESVLNHKLKKLVRNLE